MSSFSGRIISFDPVLRLGIVQPDVSNQGVVFAESDVVNTRAPLHTLIGRAVVFDLIHTERGPAAVNVRIARRLLLKPGTLMRTFTAPLLVAISTFICVYYLRWPHIQSYIISINVVTLLLVIVLSRVPFSYQLRAPDIMVFVLSILGGALGAFVASLFVPTRLRADSTRFWLVVLIILQGFALHRLDSRLLTRESWKQIVNSDLSLR